ncbi:nucleotidyltransferase family protein [Plantactinospora sp. GCM10030261]
MARCLALDTLAADTCALLHARGVDAILLKGAGLARRLGTQRHYIDVDLLVAPAKFDTAQRILTGANYRPVLAGARPDDQLFHERAWLAPGPVPLVVDLHRGFAGVDDAERFWREVRSTAEEMPLVGRTVLVPDRTHALLLVALHAADPGKADHPRMDLRLALDLRTADGWPAVDDWRTVAVAAHRCGAQEAFVLGLRTTERGRLLAAELGGLPEVYAATRWLAAQRSSATALSLARLTELPSARARLRHLRLRLLPSRAAMRYFSPLARHGPAGLLMAYAVRLARHAIGLPRAVRELRAAGRASRP